MAVKWGNTTCTVIKWGNTTCSAVYWGSTKVFPDEYKTNFNTIYTGGTSGTSTTAKYKTGTPTTGYTYRSKSDITLASVSGQALYTAADYYAYKSGTWKNKLEGIAIIYTSSKISFSGKSTLSITLATTGYSNSGQGFCYGYLYYNESSLPTVSSNKISNMGTLLINYGTMNLPSSNSTVTRTASISNLNSSYYIGIEITSSINQGMAGTTSRTVTITSLTLT